MPIYDFYCQKCEKGFTTRMNFEEFEKKKVKCPHCGSQRVEQVFTRVNVKTASKT